MNLAETIQMDIIQPNYVNEIDSFIKGRTRWRQTGVMMETLSKLALVQAPYCLLLRMHMLINI